MTTNYTITQFVITINYTITQLVKMSHNTVRLHLSLVWGTKTISLRINPERTITKQPTATKSSETRKILAVLGLSMNGNTSRLTRQLPGTSYNCQYLRPMFSVQGSIAVFLSARCKNEAGMQSLSRSFLNDLLDFILNVKYCLNPKTNFGICVYGEILIVWHQRQTIPSFLISIGSEWEYSSL